MTDVNAVLEQAISDVGHWRWWVGALPKGVQVEFGGVQLAFPPRDAKRPASSVIALRFQRPSLVAFLTEANAQGLPSDWPTALHEDRMRPIELRRDQFTLTSDEELVAMTKECQLTFLVGGPEELQNGTGSVRLGFRAGPLGFIVRAEEMVVVSAAGELSPEQILEAAAAWWAYWREYWRRRDTDDPMPWDGVCEVTIPIAE